jgi:hypothetical protein
LEHPRPVLGAPCAVYARVFDKDYRPAEERRVTARLVRADAPPGDSAAREVFLDAVSGRPGEYRGMLSNDAAGPWELRLEAPAASLAYEVSPPPQYELEPGGMAEKALREAARLSGGRFYREEDLCGLPDHVEPRLAEFTFRAERLLWNPLAMILFVGLVTAEWVLRKLSNLI